MTWLDRLPGAARFLAIWTAGVVFLMLVTRLLGCGYGRTVCKIVDTTADACVVLRYLGEDGEQKTVRVPRSELERFAKTEAARQAAMRPSDSVQQLVDAGAP